MLATIIGALGIGANAIIYQQKTGKRLLLWKLISDVLWALHYFLLQAPSGAAVAVIGIFREIVFFNRERRWAKSNLWLVFFMLCSVVSAILTWKGIYSLLPAAASVLSVFSFWRHDPRLSRKLAFPISLSMLTYDIFCLSYTGILNEILTLISASAAFLRFRKTEKSC